MKRTISAALMAVIAAGMATGAASQSASSSNPFAKISRLFGKGDAVVTSGDGTVLGPKAQLDVQVVDGDPDLAKPVRAASLVAGALAEDRSTGQDLLAAARADYARVLGVMFDQGYFSAIIYVTLDGVEAAEIAPLDAPPYVGQVVISVDPGPRFKFAKADLGPLAPGTTPPEDYRIGEVAGTGIIKRATSGAISDWREVAHAKARAAGDEIIADHALAALESRVMLDPGPAVTFGRLQATGNQRLSTRRLLKIAGYPEGEAFQPEKLDLVRKRLRRSGVFSAITLVEAETLNPDNSMDVGLTVVEQKTRRIGASFELSNVDGALVSAYWLHRNLLGGGERFRVDAQISDIKADSSDRDYSMGVRIDRPATLSPDATGFAELRLTEDNEPEYFEKRGEFSLGFNYIRTERLTADIALKYTLIKIDYGAGPLEFSTLALPMNVTFDRRDNIKDAKRGYWLSGGAIPFVGLGDTGSGLQLRGEGRVYRSVLKDDRLTFAARARAGTVLGPTILDTPPDYLFFSGGGGSVRGQPYESLGFSVPLPNQNTTAYVGGQSIATISLETRFQIREKIGAVAFVDAGQIWDDGAWQGQSLSHAGAGIGIRYDTPIGPIRFDVATPVSGDNDAGKVQLYLGLGQAF